MEALKQNHELHAVGFGVLAYAVTKKPVVGAVVGGGLYAYMKAFGHGLPTTTKPSSVQDPRLHPAGPTTPLRPPIRPVNRPVKPLPTPFAPASAVARVGAGPFGFLGSLF